MHALERIWRALAPKGVLVDVRPIAARWPLEVVTPVRVQRAGRVDDSPSLADDRAADRALRVIERRGLLRRSQRAVFSLAYVWDSLEEMQAYVAERWEGCAVLPHAVIERAARLSQAGAEPARVRIVLRMVISAYEKLQGMPRA